MAKKADRDAVAGKTLNRLKSFSARLKNGEVDMAKKVAKKKCKTKLIQTWDAHCKKRTDVVQMLKNDAGRWYWRGISAENNEITDTSGEDYSSFVACRTEAHDHAIQLGVPLQVWE